MTEMPADTSPPWHPSSIRDDIINAASELAENDIPIPPAAFYKRLAARAEALAFEAIHEAIHSQEDANILANMAIARRAATISDELIFVTQEARNATEAALIAYLLLTGNDGYSAIDFHDAWGAHHDPEWGTMWGLHQAIRDIHATVIFKVCHRGDVRHVVVECHAPDRRLPEDLHARLKARTMILSGIPVLAFSPSEVEANAEACVADISHALSILAQDLLALHGTDQQPRLDFRPPREA